ncbi:MAG: HD domain-containing protein [Treponema sp.]|jgi:HD superfamily phosphohydrolase|nr:HD domain-containing protein [Treponema sp.]
MEDPVFAVLREGFSEPVRDALWGHIYLTPGLAALTNTAPFTRLCRIFQLGPAYHVYPGATHTRASHSLGVYHLSRRLLIGLREKGASWLSPRGALSFLCAALLHDLGHFPYTHSLKDLALEDHERLSGKLILGEPLKSLIGKAGADPELTAAIVDKTLFPPGRRGSGGELAFFRRLLSGALDPDKLDYLNRDARFCGVPYGAQDVDFIYSRLYPHKERGVEIDSRGIPSVESVLFSKYLMYRTVYWHRQVRSATAMIKKALLAGLKGGIIRGEELYGLDDQGLFSLMAGRDFPPFALAALVREGKLYHEAAAFPFAEEKHGDLRNIEKRDLYEEALAAEIRRRGIAKAGAESIIIDLPEPVSFETELFVRDEGRPFGDSSSVFKKDAVETFAKSLRIIRIFSAIPLEIPETMVHFLEEIVKTGISG